jgi:hypothetical protein
VPHDYGVQCVITHVSACIRSYVGLCVHVPMYVSVPHPRATAADLVSQVWICTLAIYAIVARVRVRREKLKEL